MNTNIEQPTIAKPNEWWRWPLMPLACVAGSLLGTLALGVFLWLGAKFQGGYTTDGWYFRYIAPFIGSCLFGFLWVQIAARMAPAGKLIASIVMGTVLGCLELLMTALIWINPNVEVGEAIQFTVFNAGTIAAVIFSTMAIADDLRRGNL